MKNHIDSQRGVSLVEALMALLVMAFGMLAVVGVQTTMRSNGDIAKQRSEAVRIAQEAIERWRGYSTLDSTDGRVAYADIQSTEAVNYGPAGSGDGVVDYPTNTVYSLVRTVPDGSPPGMKTLAASVSWVDRERQTQTVQLSTVISQVAPELAGTLGVPAYGTPTRQPQGRQATIPFSAQSIDGNRSVFRPGGASDSTPAWVFDDVSGMIIQQCRGPSIAAKATVTMADLLDCTPTNALPISGYVRFGTNLDGPALPLRLGVDGASATCLDDSPVIADPTRNYVSYVCAVTLSGSPAVWSGRPRITLCADAASCQAVTGGNLILSVGAGSQTYTECRFRPHPADGYTNLQTPLANQNLALVQQGSACPSGSD